MKIGELTAVFDWDGFSRSQAALNRHLRMSERTVSRRLQSTFNTMNRMSALSSSNMARDMGRAFRNVQQIAQSAFNRVTSAYNSLRSHIRRGIVSTIKFNGINEAKGQVNGLQRQLAGLAAGVLGAAGAGQAGGFVFKTAMSFEDLEAGLYTATGSLKAAQKAFADMEKLAVKTPFKLEEVTTAFIRLKNIGLDPSNKAILAYGDIASAIPGKGIMDYVEAVADAVTGEFERLKEFGIKASKDAGNVTMRYRGEKFVAKATADGQIDPKAVERQLQLISTKFFGGSMERRAKTIGGVISNLGDAAQSVAYKMWKAGLDKPIIAAVKSMTKAIDDFLPKMKEIGRSVGVFARTDLPSTLRQINDLLPLVAAGISLMAANIVGSKIIMLVANFDKAMFLASLSATALNIAVGGLFLVAGAIILDFINYLNTGDSKLGEFAAKWPWVKQGLESAYESWKIFYFALEMGFQKIWIQLKGWMNEVKYFAKYLWDSVLEPFKMYGENLKTTFDAVKELFTWIGGKIKPLTDSLGRMAELAGIIFNRGQGDGSGVGGVSNGIPSPVAGGVGVNQSMANSLVKAAQVTKAAAGYCLNAVWRAQNLGLKEVNAGMSKIRGENAYEAADYLAKDPRFKEIKVTAQMMDDPKYARLLHGATAIFSQTSGYSRKSGHAEIWDMINKKALYGTGPKSLELSKGRLAGARVFVPRTNLEGTQTVTPAAVGGPRMTQAQPQGQTVNMTASPIQNFNFIGGNPSALTAQVGAAAQQGTAQALRSTAAQTTNRRD